jgi:hypothetical protein
MRVERRPGNGDERTINSSIPEITSKGDTYVNVSRGQVDISAVSKRKWVISGPYTFRSEITFVS